MSLVGKTAEVHLRAFPPDAAEARNLSPGCDFPAALVHSTLVNSRLTALMELAAARLMRPHLAEGLATVAVEMNVTHLVTDVHGDVRAVATWLGSRGRVHQFRVHAFDASGLIACAGHARAVVVPRRLLAGARRRTGRPSMLLNV